MESSATLSTFYFNKKAKTFATWKMLSQISGKNKRLYMRCSLINISRGPASHSSCHPPLEGAVPDSFFETRFLCFPGFLGLTLQTRLAQNSEIGLPLPLPQVLGLKACTTRSRPNDSSKKQKLFLKDSTGNSHSNLIDKEATYIKKKGLLN